ncbi:MAG: hypothetical protein AB1941_04165 [Gemmatimonadota bacterium]
MNHLDRPRTRPRYRRIAALLLLVATAVSCRPASTAAPAPAPVAESSLPPEIRTGPARVVVHNNTTEAVIVHVVPLTGGARQIGRVESRQSRSMRVPQHLVEAREHFRVQVTAARAVSYGYLSRAVALAPGNQVHVHLQNPLLNSGIEVF